MSTATPADVRNVIATDLTNSDIQPFLDDASAEIDEEVETDLSTSKETRLEKYYAAYLIRAVRDRSISSASRQSADVDYEGSSLDELRRQVQRLDPSGALARTVRVDTDRHISSTRGE